MKNLYDYTFFQIYQSIVRAKNITPVGSTILVLSFNLGLNALTLMVLCNVDLSLLLRNQKAYVIFFYLTICLINGFYFIRNKKYQIITEKYLAESEQEKKKGWNYVRLYMILSIAMLFTVIIYRN
jgi:hypothetical protein